MRNTLFALLVSLMALAKGIAQGVEFKHNDLKVAIETAQPSQLIFVDLFAAWCAPCKMMDKQIFPLERVGAYINTNFVTCRLDADSEAGKALMKDYKVEGLPTLLILDAEGKEVHRHTGMLDDYTLVRFCRTAKNDLISLDDLYKAHRKDKTNTDKMQALLLEAPYVVPTLKSENQAKKWIVRIEDTFKLYVDTKGIENMANSTDFRLLTMFKPQYTKDDPIIEKMIRYFKDFAKDINDQAVAQYITSLHLGYVMSLANDCKKEYEREIDRITGDMMHVYAAIQADPEGYKQSVWEFANAACAISKKETETYVKHMDNYLKYLPKLQYNDYAKAIEALYNGLGEKLDKVSAEAVINWGSKALEMDPDNESQSSMHMVFGDSYKVLGDMTKAKAMYNKAFELMMKSQKPQFIQNMQPVLTKRLESLNA